MTDLVTPLTAASLTLATAGGKGLNLHKLIAGGFPTPGGFVVTTEAYRTFVAANDLTGEILQVSAGTDPAQPDSFETASARLRERFQAGQMPAAIAAGIQAAYAALPAGTPVAVRSSATAEDLPEASFAGQQDTYLHIQGSAAVVAAVQKCWGSLWTARAMAYRRKQALAPDSVALAVVVQPMIAARAAGVLFTVNPVTGQRSEVVINATWGLGEALVSGQVNPDTLVVDKTSGAIQQQTIGEKAIMTAPAGTGTAEVPVDAAQRTQAVLTAADVAALTAAGCAIETHFGAPQDIEWALADNGELAILQSRPITTLGGVPGDDLWPPRHTAVPQPYDLWSQADMGERWPEPVTPLTWSMWEPITNETFRYALKALPSPLPAQTQWARRAYGRVFMNEGGMMHIYTHELGMPASRVADSMGMQGSRGSSQWNWGRVIQRLPTWLSMMSTMQKHVKAFEADFPRIDAWVEAFLQRDLSPVADAELWTEGVTVWRERVVYYINYHTSVTGMSSSTLPMLEDLLQQWFGDRTLSHTLLTGLSGVIQAEMVPALRAMADDLTRLGLASAVKNQPPVAALAHLQATPAAQPVLAQLEAFLKRHGHRCATEAEWLYPRWREAPELVIELIQGYLGTAGSGQTVDGEARQQKQRAEAEARLLARLDPFRRAYFRSMLKQAQHLVRLRDNGQNYLVKLMLPWRRLVATLGERWAARGWLEQPTDIFFLAREDIEAVLAHPEPHAAKLKSSVQERRTAYQYWFTVTAPEVLDAQGQPQATAAASGSQLKGIAASSGKITGVARLIPNPREAARLQPGEILVTRATDPGWTPVFSMIGGVVLEVGGLLSHGAIVAREYGLPAVVNVADAMRRIQDGQTITVDGTTGTVELAVSH